MAASSWWPTAPGTPRSTNYDAVENLLSIERIDPSPQEPVVITAVTPTQGKVGSTVSILGKGFSAVAAQNLVSFSGGVSATVTSASPTGLRVSVLSGAQSGPISVTTPAGSATSSTIFRVIAPLTVTPAGSSIPPGTTQQFSVSTPGGGSPPVDCAVNGIPDGNTVVGTISASGLYTAPPYVPQPVLLTISSKDQGWTCPGSVDTLVDSAALGYLSLGELRTTSGTGDERR